MTKLSFVPSLVTAVYRFIDGRLERNPRTKSIGFLTTDTPVKLRRAIPSVPEDCMCASLLAFMTYGWTPRRCQFSYVVGFCPSFIFPVRAAAAAAAALDTSPKAAAAVIKYQ